MYNRAGRPLGAKNKMSRELRALFIQGAAEAGGGGEAGLLKFFADAARENRAAYLQILAGFIPKSVEITEPPPDVRDLQDLVEELRRHGVTVTMDPVVEADDAIPAFMPPLKALPNGNGSGGV